ncbi:MAG: class D beta-lactamase, partial [Candidatus Lokiarchaeota archaeon]|nr:class D beta-lactamase [Candidatus Lokiarchaeota archaeon]
MKAVIVSSFILLLSVIVYAQTEETIDLKKYFDEYNHVGSFVLYDLKNDKYIRYNPDRCKQQFIPASTFKIFNSLAALETGAVKDENDTIRWDGIERAYAEWNKDMDMKHAFKY